MFLHKSYKFILKSMANPGMKKNVEYLIDYGIGSNIRKYKKR
jgi:hypothetical protein